MEIARNGGRLAAYSSAERAWSEGKRAVVEYIEIAGLRASWRPRFSELVEASSSTRAAAKHWAEISKGLNIAIIKGG